MAEDLRWILGLDIGGTNVVVGLVPYGGRPPPGTAANPDPAGGRGRRGGAEGGGGGGGVHGGGPPGRGRESGSRWRVWESEPPAL